jgi:hypothetical protein
MAPYCCNGATLSLVGSRQPGCNVAQISVRHVLDARFHSIATPAGEATTELRAANMRFASGLAGGCLGAFVLDASAKRRHQIHHIANRLVRHFRKGFDQALPADLEGAVEPTGAVNRAGRGGAADRCGWPK